MKPRLFIGSSRENIEVAYAVQEELDRDAEVTVWDQGFDLSKSTFSLLIENLERSDFGVFVLAPDDLMRIRGERIHTARDNVIFELGLFFGRLGADRTFFLIPDGINDLHLPTDLLGITPAKYNPQRQDENIRAAVGSACNKIRQHLKTYSKQSSDTISERICIHGAITWDIQESPEKLEKLKYFYARFLKEMERTPYGFNLCGAEPWREVFFNHYCEQLKRYNKTQMSIIDNKVWWHWFSTDNEGFCKEPSFYRNIETQDAEERFIKELENSHVVLAMAGRTGTRDQLDKLLKCHEMKEYGVDFDNKPFLIVLSWFGGTVKEFIFENKEKLVKYLSQYSELQPFEEIQSWEERELDKRARDLTKTISRIIHEKFQ